MSPSLLLIFWQSSVSWLWAGRLISLIARVKVRDDIFKCWLQLDWGTGMLSLMVTLIVQLYTITFNFVFMHAGLTCFIWQVTSFVTKMIIISSFSSKKLDTLSQLGHPPLMIFLWCCSHCPYIVSPLNITKGDLDISFINGWFSSQINYADCEWVAPPCLKSFVNIFWIVKLRCYNAQFQHRQQGTYVFVFMNWFNMLLATWVEF